MHVYLLESQYSLFWLKQPPLIFSGKLFEIVILNLKRELNQVQVSMTEITHFCIFACANCSSNSSLPIPSNLERSTQPFHLTQSPFKIMDEAM